jgi:hypothetical protein
VNTTGRVELMPAPLPPAPLNGTIVPPNGTVVPLSAPPNPPAALPAPINSALPFIFASPRRRQMAPGAQPQPIAQPQPMAPGSPDLPQGNPTATLRPAAPSSSNIPTPPLGKSSTLYQHRCRCIFCTVSSLVSQGLSRFLHWTPEDSSWLRRDYVVITLSSWRLCRELRDNSAGPLACLPPRTLCTVCTNFARCKSTTRSSTSWSACAPHPCTPSPRLSWRSTP